MLKGMTRSLCSSAWTSARKVATRSRRTGLGRNCWIGRTPNYEAKLRELYGRMKAHGPVLLVVDRPATIGALQVAVALDEASREPTSRAWRCVGSPICTRVRRIPMPEMPPSSRPPRGPCLLRSLNTGASPQLWCRQGLLPAGNPRPTCERSPGPSSGRGATHTVYVLKRASFLSAFAALSDPVSQAYCDRRRAAAEEAQ